MNKLSMSGTSVEQLEELKRLTTQFEKEKIDGKIVDKTVNDTTEIFQDKTIFYTSEFISWCEKEAATGNSTAQNLMGLMCETANRAGRHVDHEEAVKWYKMSAAQDNPCGYHNLAGMYRIGRGVDKDIKEAARLYQAALKVYDNYNSRKFLKDMLKELVKDESFVEELFSSYCESDKLKKMMADMQEVLRGCSCYEITVAI